MSQNKRKRASLLKETLMKSILFIKKKEILMYKDFMIEIRALREELVKISA